jgi:hypothetical protein
MRISQLYELAVPKKNRIKYLRLDIGGKRIGEKGCYYLSEADWPNLFFLNL